MKPQCYGLWAMGTNTSSATKNRRSRSSWKHIACVALSAAVLFTVLATTSLLRNALLPQSVSREEIRNRTTINEDSIITRTDRQHVEWVRDEQWFQQQSQLGCCPVAEKLYERRYGHVHYRCCSDRLSQIRPLRPIGGLEWLDTSSFLNKNVNTSVVVIGDSLAEQHFIALACLAWTTKGVELRDLQQTTNLNDKMGLKKGTTWTAVVEPIGVTLKFIRFNHPIVDDMIFKDDCIRKATFLVLGGWHHGGTKKQQLEAFFQNVTNLRRKRKTLIVQALPSHFPGGKYLSANGPKQYPKANVTDFSDKYNKVDNTFMMNTSQLTSIDDDNEHMCDSTATVSGTPDINDMLEDILVNQTPNHFQTLKIADLYKHRGDAHIGRIPARKVGRPGGRDCLHWCVAPGVLDAMAMETLLALST